MTSRFEISNPLPEVWDWAFDEEEEEIDEEHLEHLMRVASALEDQEFPFYCLEDPFFIDPHYPVTIKCQDVETEQFLHAVLISSFDGITWFSWIIEKQKFDLLEIDFGEE